MPVPVRKHPQPFPGRKRSFTSVPFGLRRINTVVADTLSFCRMLGQRPVQMTFDRVQIRPPRHDANAIGLGSEHRFFGIRPTQS